MDVSQVCQLCPFEREADADMVVAREGGQQEPMISWDKTCGQEGKGLGSKIPQRRGRGERDPPPWLEEATS